jgi:hypothetical protein
VDAAVLEIGSRIPGEYAALFEHRHENLAWSRLRSQGRYALSEDDAARAGLRDDLAKFGGGDRRLNALLLEHDLAAPVVDRDAGERPRQDSADEGRR